jgi:hypothetical protein
MTRAIKRIHMYLGLVNCAILATYGIAGLAAALGPHPRPRPEAVIETRAYTVPPNLSDVEAAAAIQQFLGETLANPAPAYAVRRNREGNLAFDLYSVNGPVGVTVLEGERQLRLERRRNAFVYYLSNLHATTLASRAPDLRIRLWAWYNEFAIWSLIAMALSGLYLWLATRPRFGWAQLSFVAGGGVFLALYALMR